MPTWDNSHAYSIPGMYL